MARHLRIVRGNLIASNGKNVKKGTFVWRQGNLITNPIREKIVGWYRTTTFPQSEVKDIAILAGGSSLFPREAPIAELFGTKSDAISPVEIATGVEVKEGATVWVFLPSSRAFVAKRVVSYNSERVALCYPDVYKRALGSGCFVTYHQPENVFPSAEDGQKAIKCDRASIATIRTATRNKLTFAPKE